MPYSSTHFRVEEFRCHDGTDVPAHLVDTNLAALASQLDIIRDGIGTRLQVVSGYRTESYNHAIKGAVHSQHLTASAADIRPYVMSEGHAVPWEFVHKAQRLHLITQLEEHIGALLMAQRLPLVGGVGVYAGKWIHVDVRPRPADGHIARWTGVGIGSEA